MPPVEVVARTINEKGKYRFGQKGAPDRPRVQAFQVDVNESTERLELSTFCMDGLEEEDRWTLLRMHGDRRVFGRTEFGPAIIQEFNLTLDPDWDPERHVSVIGWPENETMRQSLILKLCERLTAIRAPAA